MDVFIGYTTKLELIIAQITNKVKLTVARLKCYVDYFHLMLHFSDAHFAQALLTQI